MEGEDFEMNGEAQRVVELARQARTPGDADKRRVRAALAASLGAGVLGAASSVAVASAAKGVGLAVGARALLAVVLLASAGGGAYYYYGTHVQHGSAPAAPVAAPPAPAPAIIEQLPPAAAPAGDPLLAELTLLRQAQRALRDGDARRALDLAARHAALYPRSQMALERGALRVFAFCALGRKAEARTLAHQLIAEAPTSPMRKSLEESCGMR